MKVEENLEYVIPGTDFFAMTEGDYWIIYHCDGYEVKRLPVNWSEKDLNIWGRAYLDGMEAAGGNRELATIKGVSKCGKSAQ